MFNQTFAPADLITVGVLVLLEALLSADNALILAIIVRHLPKDQQKKALYYGLLGAFVLRIGAILIASTIISYWWLQLIGAAYLIYLPVKHFRHLMSGDHKPKGKEAGFWMTVVYADLADLAFAIDSVIVAVAFIKGSDNNADQKLWVVIAGAVLGIILLRFAANLFLKLLERYPFLDHVAYVLVGWAGFKLLFVTGHTFEKWYDSGHKANPLAFSFPELPQWIFWVGIAVICIGGGWLAVKNAKKEGDITHIREVVEEVGGE